MPKKLQTYTRLRVDKATLDAWRKAARDSGLTLSAWIRVRCNGVEVIAHPPKAA